MARLLATILLPLALQAPAGPGFAGFSMKLPAQMRAKLEGRAWHAGCPVPLSGLRLLTVRHYGFDGKVHVGQLVVNEAAARPLLTVFHRLYELRFPIRRMRFADAYVRRPAPDDPTAAFMCRDAVPSPCPGSRPTGSWSQHAYGLAVDLNPRENPYVGCGMSRDPGARRYIDRSRLREGMVTPAVVSAFRSIGWGWGGDWRGVKDYMHFSASGH